MKAILLTHDKRAPFAELVVKSYDALWKNHRLEFIMPYNDKEPEFVKNHKNIHLVKCGKPVRQTMSALLADIDDDEFVYWALDDIYPHKILKASVMNDLYDYVTSKDKIPFDAARLIVHLTVNGRPKGAVRILVGNHKFCDTSFSSYGFWFHQFIRAKVLKDCFLNNKHMPNDYSIEKLGYHRDDNPHLYRHTIYIPQTYLAILGETTRYANRITKNAHEALEKYGIKNNREMKQISAIFNNRKLPKLDKQVVKLL